MVSRTEKEESVAEEAPRAQVASFLQVMLTILRAYQLELQMLLPAAHPQHLPPLTDERMERKKAYQEILLEWVRSNISTDLQACAIDVACWNTDLNLNLGRNPIPRIIRFTERWVKEDGRREPALAELTWRIHLFSSSRLFKTHPLIFWSRVVHITYAVAPFEARVGALLRILWTIAPEEEYHSQLLAYIQKVGTCRGAPIPSPVLGKWLAGEEDGCEILRPYLAAPPCKEEKDDPANIRNLQLHLEPYRLVMDMLEVATL